MQRRPALRKHGERLVLLAVVAVLSVVTSASSATGAGWSPTADAVALKDLFVAGMAGVHCFRIPALAVVRTDNPAVPPGYGQAILAFAEARYNSCSDGGPKAIAFRRSLDAGSTWSDLQLLVPDDRKTVRDGLNLGATVVLPTRVPGGSDRVLVFYTECAHECDVAPTLVLESDDAGRTFGSPRNITGVLLQAGVGMWAPGPDHGVVLRAAGRTDEGYGSRHPAKPLSPATAFGGPAPAGRLVVCGQARPPKVGQSQGTICLLSDDQGKTYRVGGRLRRSASHWWNECLPVQLGNGSVLLNVRDEVSRGRGFAISEDGGESFSAGWNRPDLPDPHCQGSMVRLWGSRTIVMSNDRNSSARADLALSVSTDEGATWQKLPPLWQGPSAYSSLAVLFDPRADGKELTAGSRRGVQPTPNPTVAVMFERGTLSPYESISFTLAAGG